MSVDEAAAFHGLALNAVLSTAERLRCALQALDLYEAGRADAWGEGFDAGHENAVNPTRPTPPVNPYR